MWHRHHLVYWLTLNVSLTSLNLSFLVYKMDIIIGPPFTVLSSSLNEIWRRKTFLVMPGIYKWSINDSYYYIIILGFHLVSHSNWNFWGVKGALFIVTLGQQEQTGTVLGKPGNTVPPPTRRNCLCCQKSCHSGAFLGHELGGFELRVSRLGCGNIFKWPLTSLVSGLWLKLACDGKALMDRGHLFSKTDLQREAT